MTYKLINTKTKEETLCDKVNIDEFNYYVPSKLLSALNQNLKVGDVILSSLYGLGKIINDYGGIDSERNRPLIAKFSNSTTQQMYHRSGIWQLGKSQDVSAHNSKKVIACNNPNIDIPKVVDNKKSQESRLFSEKDMISFLDFSKSTNKKKSFYEMSCLLKGQPIESSQLFKLWKEQQPKIIYYE